MDFSVESVNDPPASQNTFDRKGSRGSPDFDVRNNFVANVVYELPGRGRLLGGRQVSGVATVHSVLPFTRVLDFDNANVQSLLTAERPNLVGNPYSGICPKWDKVGAPSCWFNPSAFAVPRAGPSVWQCRTKYPAGPGFAQFDAGPIIPGGSEDLLS